MTTSDNFSIFNFWCQDPPLQLTVDESSVSDIDEENDGVWSIIGGKVNNVSFLYILMCSCHFPITDEI